MNGEWHTEDREVSCINNTRAVSQPYA